MRKITKQYQELLDGIPHCSAISLSRVDQIVDTMSKEQRADLSSMIKYLQENQVIASVILFHVIHDLLMFENNDGLGLPRSNGYTKKQRKVGNYEFGTHICKG